MTSRADILAKYIKATDGRPVGDPNTWGGPQSPALANDWLQYLTGRRLYVPGHAIQWADAVDEHGGPTGDELNASLTVLSTVATFYPAEVHHRAVYVPPEVGDIVVFRTVDGFPGTLGIYLEHGPRGWTVYTQGHMQKVLPAARFYLTTGLHHAVGWWRVRPECIHSAHGYTHEWQVPA